jgi:hypothetical protein
VTNQTKVQSIDISFDIIKIFKEIDQVQVNYLPNVLIVKKGETIWSRSPLSIYDPNTDSLFFSSQRGASNIAFSSSLTISHQVPERNPSIKCQASLPSQREFYNNPQQV